MDVGEFRLLASLNQYRGSHSYSIAEYRDGDIRLKEQQLGTSHFVVEGKGLHIGHVQAPTTSDRDISNIHPCQMNGNMLWHNGIIKDKQVAQWRGESEDIAWDTYWLMKNLEERGWGVLSETDGAFACLYFYQGELYLFRNHNCPMFLKESTFSSTRFDKSSPIKSGVVYKYDGSAFASTDITFNTNQPYFFSLNS